MSKRKAFYSRKIKQAAQILFFRKHRKAGVKGWELRRVLGADYPKVLKIMQKYLEPFGLEVKTVFEDDNKVEKPTLKQVDKARFCIRLSGQLTPKTTKMMGWRIDDLAGLAITVAYITSNNGKAPRKEVAELLREKLPEWKVNFNIDRYINYGYITQDEKKLLYMDWRTRAEIDHDVFVDLLLKSEI